eukprot:1354414-Amorphochlora_amoeboformis.AAC.1
MHTIGFPHRTLRLGIYHGHLHILRLRVTVSDEPVEEKGRESERVKTRLRVRERNGRACGVGKRYGVGEDWENRDLWRGKGETLEE